MADPLKPSAPRSEGVPAVPSPEAVRALDLATVRTLRREAQLEESDLSYLRRLLQGRIDILRAESARRRDPAAGGPGAGDGAVVGNPVRDARAARGGARHVTVHPPGTSRYRQRIERVLADVEWSDLPALDDAGLLAALDRLTGYEHEVSSRRQELQRVADQCGAEIARRYREGEARVDDLLSGR
ncbi:RsiG family protein [Yinghuangia aomiensis]